MNTTMMIKSNITGTYIPRLVAVETWSSAAPRLAREHPERHAQGTSGSHGHRSMEKRAQPTARPSTGLRLGALATAPRPGGFQKPHRRETQAAFKPDAPARERNCRSVQPGRVGRERPWQNPSQQEATSRQERTAARSAATSSK